MATSAFPGFGQQSSDDFFPLSIGNRWTYDYFASDWEQLGDSFLRDSGAAAYKIIGRSSAEDSTIWIVNEVRSIMRRITYFFDRRRDTSYVLNDSVAFAITEYHGGNHRVSSGMSNWESVFYLDSRFVDSSAFFRYFPLQSEDTLTVVRASHQGSNPESLVVTYQRLLGLTRVSYSGPAFPGAVFRCNHARQSAVLTTTKTNNGYKIPNVFTLDQNFPNPFNSMTTIPFYASKGEKVTIQIYDLLGRLVAGLLDHDVGAGYHSLIWNASRQSSGTYICVSQAGGQSRVIRLTLLR